MAQNLGEYFDNYFRGTHLCFCFRPIQLLCALRDNTNKKYSFLLSPVSLRAKFLSPSLPLFFTIQLLLSYFYLFSPFLISKLLNPLFTFITLTPWQNHWLIPLNNTHIPKSSGHISDFILLHCSALLHAEDYSVLPETIFHGSSHDSIPPCFPFVFLGTSSMPCSVLLSTYQTIWYLYKHHKNSQENFGLKEYRNE